MSGAEQALAPAEWERHAEACAKMRRAEEALHSAMAGLKSAAMSFVRAEADVAGQRKAQALIDIAASCPATWGGGCLSENNIIETAKRREALELLRRLKA